jgi:hypothetical protein
VAANVITDIDPPRPGERPVVKRVLFLLAAAVVLAVTSGAPRAGADERSVASLTTREVTASGHGVSDCGDFPPDAPGAGRDGWVFQAPARFLSARLEFTGAAGATSAVDMRAANAGGSAWGSRFFDNGTELWVSTPAGWTLRAGTAELAGAAGSGFALIRTCWGQAPTAAEPAPDAGARAFAGGAAGESANQKIVVVVAATGSPSPSPTADPRPTGPRPGKPSGAGLPGHLPTTGGPIAILVAAAVVLIVVGAALRRVRRSG